MPVNISETISKTTREHQVWALAANASCARQARTLVHAALTALVVPRDIVHDAKLMISELATNAHQHAGGHVPHELWFDRGVDEFVCAVFDTLPVKDLAEDLAFSGDFGRGLSIVAELSVGRWGRTVANSRLMRDLPGKAVWFACKLPAHGS
jgi:hypothetical protein